MKKMRTTLLLFVAGTMGAILISPCGAADAAADPQAVAADPLAVAADPLATAADPLAVAADPLAASPDPLAVAAGCPKCTCTCSPWVGAWVGCFSEDGKDRLLDSADKCERKVVETFKFAPMNLTCDQFVLNLQASLCEAKVLKAFPEANDVTEFVGVACKSDKDKVVFTAIGYGVKKSRLCDEVVFIAIKSGTLTLPCSTGDPNAVDVKETIEIFAAEQDTNCDGLPDDCESVMCLSRTGMIKRILNKPQCEPSKSFIAILDACKDVNTVATGKAFFKRVDNQDKLSFVVTVKSIKDVTKVVIHVSEAPTTKDAERKDTEESVVLCPIPPGTKCKSGEFSGVLCCGTIMEKDYIGPMKGKKMDEVIKAITEGRAVVVVKTKQYPKGELCGCVEDP